MLPGIASVLTGVALAGAAGAKVSDPVGASVGLSTYSAPPWRALVWVLAGAEVAVAWLVVAGVSRWPAAALLAAFALAQAAALALGRGGSPCGCGGGRGRLSWRSAAQVAALAGLAAAAGGGVGWIGAGVLVAASVGAGAWWSWRAQPSGALDIAGEGPELGSILDIPATAVDGREQPRGRPRLVLFVADGCPVCRRLRGARLDVPVVELDARDWPEVPGAPYAVLLDAGDRVIARGTPNTRRQLANLARLEPATPDAAAHEPTTGHASRRAFLHRTAAAASALAAGGAVKPGDAEAFHFCGHIYTTDGCPHPTGLPRIDSRGFPLRAADGRRVDDLGRLVDTAGAPVDDEGNPLLDADGIPLPSATRTRVCTATADAYGISTRVDGAWYRCCGGHVRKLVDCCTTGRRRINGDRALRGYCYGKRKVFCVMYYQTRVPC